MEPQDVDAGKLILIPFIDINKVVIIKILPVIFLPRWWLLVIVATMLVNAMFVDATILLYRWLLVFIIEMLIDVLVLLQINPRPIYLLMVAHA
jgi:hypothetical protein